MSAVTTPRGRDVATPARSAHVFGCSDLAVAWPPLASGARSHRCCLRNQAVLPPASPRCCTADPPRAATQPLLVSSHHHRVCAYPLHLCAVAGPVQGRHYRVHVAELAIALSFMALRPRRPCRSGTRVLIQSVCAHASTITPTMSCQGEPELSPPIAPRLSLCCRRQSRANTSDSERSSPINLARLWQC